MTVFGIAMVRDEADIIEATVRNMLEQVDHVLVADNGSVDETPDILREAGVEVIDDPDPAYFQSRKMSRLAALAAERGADWCVPFDADELWYSTFGTIREALADRPEAVVPAELYDHVPSSEDDPDEPDPVKRIGWRRRLPAPLRKVACRPVLPVTIHQGNHGASYGAEHLDTAILTVRHYPLRSPAQMIRKARNGGKAYEATDLPESDGQHWRDWNRLSDEQLTEVFYEYYHLASPANVGSAIFDPAPCLASAS